LLPQIFPHLFIHKIKKEKHFFLLPFPQNRNFSPNNLVVSFEKCNFAPSFYIEKCKFRALNYIEKCKTELCCIEK